MYSQQEVNSLLNAAIPDVLSSSVLIVAAKRPRFGPFATGVLFQVADVCFVITAAHAIRDAYKASVTIGMECDGNSFFVFHRDFSLLDVASFKDFDDTIDIALYQLSDGEIDRLTSKRFLRQSDVGNVSDNGICTVFGYPGVLTNSPTEGDRLEPRGLTLTVPVYTGSTASLLTFDLRYSFLLDPNWRSSGVDGQDLQMSDLSARALNTSRDYKGMSGGPVWMIATSGTNPISWHRDLPKLVGLQIGVYPESGLLRVTRWSTVLGFIKMVHPELAPSIDLVF